MPTTATTAPLGSETTRTPALQVKSSLPLRLPLKVRLSETRLNSRPSPRVWLYLLAAASSAIPLQSSPPPSSAAPAPSAVAAVAALPRWRTCARGTIPTRSAVYWSSEMIMGP